MDVKNVFITKNGDKYHLYESCVKKYHPKLVTKEEAIKKGLQLCKTCQLRLLEKKPLYKNNKNFYKKENHININNDDADDIIYNDPLMKEQETTEEEYIDIKRNKNLYNNRSNNIKLSESESQTIDFNKNNEINNNNSNNYNNNYKYIEEQSENSEKKDVNIDNNNQSDKDNNNYINKNENNKKKVLEKIQENIEKDKKFGNDIIKKNEIKPYYNDIKNEIIEEVKYNYMENSEESKEDSILNNNSINSYKTISKNNNIGNYNNNLYNNNKIKLCGGGDMDILKETDESAISISFPNKDYLCDNINKELYKNLQNGKYKYTFEIKNLKENKFVEIEVGFKIKYKTSFDINFKEENFIKHNNRKFKSGTLWDKMIVSKDLIFGENSDVIYAFINIKKGKFVVIGRNELEKRRKNIYLTRENAEIFYIKNCGPIYYFEISDVEPIFQYNGKATNNCIIKFNGKAINSNI